MMATSMTVGAAPLRGEVCMLPSKSVMHRALICASLADEATELSPLLLSEDIKATLTACRTLLSYISIGDTITVTGRHALPEDAVVNCRESGSTIRFFLPIAAALGAHVTFIGEGRLPQRPLTPLFELFDQTGFSYTAQGNLPVTLQDRLTPGTLRIRGDVSSQFITGLLLALPLLGDSVLEVTTPLESRPYVDITLDIMKQFGITCSHDNYRSFTVQGTYRSPGKFTCEGDWSNAAFWLVANALGGEIAISNLSPATAQGDCQIVSILQQCGLSVEDHYLVHPTQKMVSLSINVSDIPDLVPILAVLGSFCCQEMRLVGAARLRLKESDRLSATAGELNRLGANITELEDGLIIRQVDQLHGGQVSSHNDHRIAMALAIAAQKSTAPVIIDGADAVQKSYPAFWQELERLKKS